MNAPMSRLRINDLRRFIATAEMPERARARQLARLDEMEGEWVNEVWRRWQRRRYAPFRAFDKAVSDLLEAIMDAPVLRALPTRCRR